MLAGGDLKAGNAGYVALETITGALEGTPGHSSSCDWDTMEGSKLDLPHIVVPGSGGALRGIIGTLRIDNNAAKHAYTLVYTLPPQP